MLLWRMSLDFCCCFLPSPQRGSTDVHEAMPYYYVWMRNFTSLSVSAFRSSPLVTCQARQWLLPREAMVPYVCQKVYVVCFFWPDLFPCLLSNEPRSPLGVGAEASRYLYSPNSWGPPSQSSEGWVEKLSWKLQVKPSVWNVSLFPLLYSLVILSVICLSPRGVQSGQVRSCSAQVSRTARQTSLIYFTVFVIFLVFSLFLHSATDVFTPFSLSHTFFPLASN